MKILRNFENKSSLQLQNEIEELEMQRKKLKQGIINETFISDEPQAKSNYSIMANAGFIKSPLKPRKQRTSKIPTLSYDILQNYKNQLIDREIKKSNKMLTALESKYNAAKSTTPSFSKLYNN